MTQQLHPVIPQYHPVSGHQDTKNDKPLTLPTQLNVDCNRRASKLPLCYDPLIQCNPLTDNGYPHLTINQQPIIQHLQHMLCDAATCKSYITYLTDKLQWSTPPTPPLIHWKSPDYSPTQRNA